jgi:NAD(P)-dependent dehydrogenase (short-subunit alcohol dehydrogenase family)
VEWADAGVRMNAVAPWFIRTPLTEPILKGELLEDVAKRTPMGRVGEASDSLPLNIIYPSFLYREEVGHLYNLNFPSQHKQ